MTIRSNHESYLPALPCGGSPGLKVLAFRSELLQFPQVSSPFERPGDNHARSAALEAMRNPLIGYFRKRVKQQDDVGDLVQEVFLRASNRGSLDEIANLRSYLFQVAESVLTDRQRRRAARHTDAHVEFIPEHMGDMEIGPDRIIAGRDGLRRALAALDRLPERTRTVFVLRRLEGMRYLDIAKRLGLSVSAVEKHMVRAIAHLAAAGDLR